ncbi:hypothetical protein [Rhodoferax fermentans]|uniref:hypothetical protein n=1 Tax=Rhodoferax fermentans TaxID=28066 RepID=UPI00117AEA74|nr:hypothetical protein [Rhodoferax fermentans]
MDIFCFDVLSHAKMHLPFNESYIRILLAAFPADKIHLYAVTGHVANLRSKFPNQNQLTFTAIEPAVIPFGASRHNPLFARLGANKIIAKIKETIKGKEVRLVTLMGVDAGLYSAVAAKWPTISKKPIHLLMHAQLGDAMIWRSRNPLIKAGDFVSQLNKRVANNIKIVALELGVAKSITQISPHLAKNIVTLEHPVVPDECFDIQQANQKIRIGFLGHANRNKGFDIYSKIALSCNNPNIEFHAIGIEAKSDGHPIDTTALFRKPTPGGLSRGDYLAGLREVDLICSPLYSRCYDFIASGTVSDAITNLKPIIGLKSNTLQGIQEKYGPIGRLFENAEEMLIFFNNLQYDKFVEFNHDWRANLLKVRNSRLPDKLSVKYSSDCLDI